MKLSQTSLLFVALLCGAVWRAELEWKWGWAGLTWAWQLYWAFPLGILSFIAWTAFVVRPLHPWRYSVVLGSFFTAAFVGFWHGLETVFVVWRMPPPESIIRRTQLVALSLPVLWALMPVAFGWLCRLFGARVHFGLHLLSSGLFIASWPLAVWLLDVVDHRGGADLIHALKSGFVIPLLVFSLGVPLLFAKQADESAARTA